MNSNLQLYWKRSKTGNKYCRLQNASDEIKSSLTIQDNYSKERIKGTRTGYYGNGTS